VRPDKCVRCMDVRLGMEEMVVISCGSMAFRSAKERELVISRRVVLGRQKVGSHVGSQFSGHGNIKESVDRM